LTDHSDGSSRVSRERLLASSRGSGIPPPTFRVEALPHRARVRVVPPLGDDLMERKRRSGIKFTMPRDAGSWLEAQRSARGFISAARPELQQRPPMRRKARHEQSQNQGRS